MIRSIKRWWLEWAGVLLLVVFPCVAPSAQPTAPIEVFASILPQKHFVERLGGGHVVVSVLVGPGQSPATYEPTPNQLSRLSRARVYFRIGVEFEEVWMKRIAAVNPGMRIIDLHHGLALRQVDQPLGPTEPAAAQERADPHVWTSPPLVRAMAARIRDTLSELDPAHGADYDANYRAFVRDLDRLDHDIRAVLAGVSRRNFMVFHPAWGYFADAYDLQQIPIETGGKEPGARSLAQVIETGRKNEVKVIFVQAQFSRRTAETIARSIGARVVAVDPLAEDYLENMRRVTAEFAEAMQ